MSNYLRNVAHRAAGASLLRPRVPSRFEPASGLAPAMNHFREMVTEREAEAPRATRAMETRLPPPVSSRAAETQPRREESRARTSPTPTHTVEERVVLRKEPEIGQPRPSQESRTQNNSGPNAPTAARSPQPGITQEPAETRVPITREVTGEKVQPRPDPARQTPPTEVPVAPQFPAPAAERREAIDKPALPRPVPRADSPVRNREIPAVPSPAAHTHFAVPQIEIATRDVHVTIGKVTVQANFPAAPVHAPARMPAHTGPRLTLERYLDRRGGRP